MSKRKQKLDEKIETASGQPDEELTNESAVADEVLPAEAELADDDSAELDSELEQLRAEAADNLDKYLRAVAELENVRRRAEIDIANAHKYALDKFAPEVMTVRDSLEQARAANVDNSQSGQADPLLEKMLEGIDLTVKQLDNVFQKFQLSILDPIGEKFDPELHQALSMIESDEVAPNHVLNVVQKGCMLNDRLLRPAMVVIAKEKSDQNQVIDT